MVERTPEAVANGISAVLNDPAPRLQVAALAERFSWETNAAELAAHYDRLTG